MNYDPDTFLPNSASNWRLIRNRLLNKGQIFVSHDGTQYLRIGPSSILQPEVAFAKSLKASGFPVASILDDGEVDGTTYFIEESLGEQTFGRIFKNEYMAQGKVSSESFNAYCQVAANFLRAQLQNVTEQASDIPVLIRLSKALGENPQFDTPALQTALDTITGRLSKLPSAPTHGDLTPFNILKGGVIDFEHNFTGPVGYDVLAGVLFGRFWDFKDKNGESKLSYDLTDDQLGNYMRVIDDTAAKHNIKQLSSYTNDVVLLRAVWALAGDKDQAEASGDDSKWRFRQAILSYCVAKYNARQPIATNTFGQLA